MIKPKRAMFAYFACTLWRQAKRGFVVLALTAVLLPLFSYTRGGMLAHVGLGTQTASALTSDTLNFQARLESTTGAIAPDGHYNIRFNLYSASTGGSSLWNESYSYTSGAGQCSGPVGANDCRVRVANGYVSVYLGSITSFPTTIPWDQQLYLTMDVGGTTSSGTITWDGEMSPRLKLTAVPYAMRANSATQLQTSNALGTLTSTLSIAAPTNGNQVFQIQDQGAAGTYNILTTAAGSDGYVKLQGGTPVQQTGGFNVSGDGTVAGVLQGGSLKAGSTQQFQVDTNGNVTTGGTYNGNTFTNTTLTFSGAAASTINSTSGQNLVLNAAGATSLLLQSGGTTAVRINSTGTVSMGTVTAGSRLVLNGIAVGSPNDGSTLRALASTVTDSATAAGATAPINHTNGFEQNTIAATNTNVTTTNSATVYIQGSTKAGTNQAITNSYGLQIDTASVAGGNGVQNAYGLSVQAPTGATNNYAAIFQGGNVGIGTASPQAQLEVKGATGISSGAVTMTATNGAVTFTTSSSMTLNRGDWIVPTTSTGQATYVTTTATGTSFTGFTPFTANIAGETFTIYHSITNVTNNSGTSLFNVYGNGSISIGDYLNGAIGSAMKFSVNGSAAVTGNIWTPSISNLSSAGNAFIQLNNTGTVISRNVADANTATTIYQQNASSTGNILDLKNSSGVVASFNQAGNLGIGTSVPTAALDVRGSAVVAGTGTISSSGSTVTGVGTSFLSTLTTGDVVNAAGQYHMVGAVTSDTVFMTTGSAFTPAITDTAYTIIRPTERIINSSAGQIGLSIQMASGAAARSIAVFDSAGNYKFYVGAMGDTVAQTYQSNGGLFTGASGVGTVFQSSSSASVTTGSVTLRSGNATGAGFNSGNIIIDSGTATGTAGAIQIGTTNASAITIGKAGITTTVAGSISITPQTSTSTTLLCSNSGVLSTCDSSVKAPTNSNFIANGSTQQTSANFNIDGIGTAASMQANNFDMASPGTLSIGGTNATTIAIGNTTGAVARTITIGTNTTAGSVTTLTLGSTIGASATTIQSGTGGLALSSTTSSTYSASGSINITAGGGSTWKTTSGALTVQAAGDLTLTAGSANTVKLGDTSATISIGSGSNLIRTINIGTAGTSQTQTVNIGSTGGASALNLNAGTGGINLTGVTNVNTSGSAATTIGNSLATTTLGSRTIIIGSSGGTNTVQAATQTTANFSGDQFIIKGSTGNGTGAGGVLTISGGDGGASNANGGALVLTGGASTGTGVMGLVNLNPTAFTGSNTAQSFGVSGTLANIDTYSTFKVQSTVSTGVVVTIPAPTTQQLGRIIYVSNSGVNDFTISLFGTAVTINLKANSTATLVWNGNGWTAAGASSATDLQAAYNNTQSAAGGAEIVLGSAGGQTDGITIRNNGSAPLAGALFEVQSSIATNLFSVNNNTTEYATNGGAENASFTGWANYNGGTATRSTTAGTYATGVAAVGVTTSGVNQGAKNTLASSLTAGTYVVSFAARTTSGTSIFNMWYSANGTAQTVTCDTSLTGSGYTISQNFSVTTSWTKVSCFITVPGGSTASNAILIANQSNTSFYVDNLSVISNAAGTTPANVQIGGGASGGQPTLLTLDQFAGPPMTTDNPAYYGSMYYDTTKGAIQCYQSNGWGACGNAPDDIVSLTPEYTGAVLNGSGVGTMTADFCANQSGVLTVGTLCASGEARNFYKWTSPQATPQSYSIYVTYRLPSTFKNFATGSTSLTSLVDNTTNASVKYAIFRKAASGTVYACSADATMSGTVGSWNPTQPTTDMGTGACAPGGANPFVGGDTMIIRITVTAQSNASAYVENLTFRYSNK